jgi:GGDEF domain-containing protein
MEQPRTALTAGSDGYGRVHKSYFRAARWSRVASVLFWVFFVAFLFWALPVFPWGMTRDDYSPKVLLALFLLGCCPAVAAVGLLAGSIAAQRREVLVAWASIYDEATGLRNREFFLERLELQCQLGRDLTEYRIGVILLTVEERALDGQKPQPTDDETFRRIGMHLVDQMRPSDLVAAISSTEMAVLVSAGSTSSLGAIVSRVWRSVETRAPELAGPTASRLLIRMGNASLDSVEPKPELLLEAARNTLKPVYSGKTEAAA